MFFWLGSSFPFFLQIDFYEYLLKPNLPAVTVGDYG